MSKLRLVEIPKIRQDHVKIRLVGDRPLMVNNKMAVVPYLNERYSTPGGKSKAKEIVDDDEAYSRAFYVFKDSKFKPPSKKGSYGIPTSGIKKCADKAIRTTGISDNTAIGEISKSFFVLAEKDGLSRLKFRDFDKDERMVNIGSGQKTVPQLRRRPIFFDWTIDLDIMYNPLKMSPEGLVNLFMHAGIYIGLCEMRAEKKQGECGGFGVELLGEEPDDGWDDDELIVPKKKKKQIVLDDDE